MSASKMSATATIRAASGMLFADEAVGIAQAVERLVVVGGDLADISTPSRPPRP